MLMNQNLHLEDIYDLPTDHLRKLQEQLRQNSQGRQQLLETILIEIEERKTLQFFGDFLEHDNPYAKKVQQYNKQFLKLASIAIKEQTNEEKILKPQPKNNFHEQNKTIENVDHQVKRQHVEIEDDNRSRMCHTQLTKKSNSQESRKTDNISQISVDKKMNIGISKKKKNTMKEMMANMLAKTKVQGNFTIGRGVGQSPGKEKITAKVYIPGQKHSRPEIPTHKKAIKKSEQKVMVEKKNEAQVQKRKKEIVEKMKHTKTIKTNVKLPSVNSNKKLVEMVKREEQEKKMKKEGTYQSKQKKIKQKTVSLPVITDEKVKKQQSQEVVQEIECTDEKEQEQTQKEINNFQSEKSVPEDIVKEDDIIQEEEIEESLSPKKIQKQGYAGKGQELTKLGVDEQKKQITNQKQKEAIKQNQNQLTQKNESIPQLAYQYRSENIIISQNKETERRKEQNIASFEKVNLEKQKNQVQIISLQQQREKEEKRQNSEKNIEKQPKKCYNEQYWMHIRWEAQEKIKRFREKRQLQQQYKLKKEQQNETKQEIKEQVSKGQNKQQEQQSKREENTDDLESKEVSQDIIDRENELKKMKNIVKKMGVKKKAEEKVQPQKTIRPKPQFDYLQVYPSFNHIFSIMYLKSGAQAQMDLPILMKELKNLFSTHVQHFQNKKTFQPAIFLPFDNANMQFGDPRQMILHAENTFVDLKTMIERTEIFNGNLHGTFATKDNRYYRVIRSREEVYDIITTGFLRRKGWKQLPHGCGLKFSWNFFWSWSKPDIDLSKLLVWQRINHFPFNKNLSRKDLLYKNLQHFRKQYRVSMNFLPLTFNLPKDFTPFSIKFHQEQITNRDQNYWIMKPIGKSRGRGIKVIGSLSQLNYIDNIVVQKYISNPMLLDGYKFDMRIYVLVTSFHPLEAFVYGQGFARLSTQKYSLNPQSLKNNFMHLTNFSVNKNNLSAKQQFSGGSKISIKSLKQKLSRLGYSFPDIWKQVHQIIIKSLLGCSISVPAFPTAFELFGYDIMIDSNSQCHLIQINSSPSLQRSFLLDQIIKQSLIDDILQIVNPPNFNKQELLDVISERLRAMQSGKKKMTEEEDLIDLARVLNYQRVRKTGQVPEKMGLFEMIAPSSLSTELEKLIKSRSGANNPLNID